MAFGQDVEFEVDDLFAKLRPAMSRFSTLEEAAEALQRQEQGSEAQGGAEATGVGGDEAAGVELRPCYQPQGHEVKSVRAGDDV